MIHHSKLLPTILVCAAMLLITVNAHTLFLRPHAFIVPDGREASIPLINGTFAKNEGKVILSRLREARIVTPTGAIVEIQDSEWRIDSNDITTLTTMLEANGTYVVGAGTKPNLARIEAEEFNFYLRYEGLHDDIAERERLKETGIDAAERYSKYAKALLQVGDTPSDNYDATLGHDLEIVPLVNPYELGVGDSFKARVLKNGEPLTNALTYVNNQHHVSIDEEGIHQELARLRTDNAGEIEFELTQPGHWYVRLIDLLRTGDSEHWYSGILVKVGADEPRIPYESVWATLTFEVR